MNKPFARVILGCFLLSASSASAANLVPAVPALKAVATVSSDIVRIGDLIENAGAAADIPVFHAPELGASGTIQTHRVIEVGRQNGIAHFDTRGLSEVTVFRAARNISLAELEHAVAEAAMRHLGLPDAANVSVRFDRDVRPLQVESDTTEPPRVVQFSYDTRSQRFEGTVEVTGSLSLRKHPIRLTGTMMETAEVIVLARALNRGDNIRESDILIERRPRNDVAADTLARVAAVVGQSARRSLRAGQTIRPADLMKPDLVNRNDMVTILFEVPGITLTARGKSLDAGAEGETVSVVNQQSKRILHATVQGPGLVIVSRGAAVTADATGALR